MQQQRTPSKKETNLDNDFFHLEELNGNSLHKLKKLGKHFSDPVFMGNKFEPISGQTKDSQAAAVRGVPLHPQHSHDQPDQATHRRKRKSAELKSGAEESAAAPRTTNFESQEEEVSKEEVRDRGKFVCR